MSKPQKHHSTRRVPWFWYVGGGVVLAVLAVGLYFWLAGSHPQSSSTAVNDNASPAKGQTIDGIRCETSESLLFHIHTDLTIMVAGKEQAVPENIGILPGRCLYWVHTHDNTGEIHIESPIKRDFTLGDFFDIWGQPLNAKRFLDKAIDAEHSVRAYVNGQQYLSDPREIVLKDLDKIVLMYGPPFPPLPVDQ